MKIVMTITQSNPYESPPIVNQREVDPVIDQRRHHLSNRFMSLVFGLPGLAMFVVASIVLVVAGMTMMDARNGNAYPVIFLFGIMGFLLGATMLWIAVFLWRYDSDKPTHQVKTKARSKPLSP